MTRGFEWLTDEKVKLGLLAFLFVWIGIVTVTNIINGLDILGLAGGDIPFSSGNYEMMRDKASHLNPPEFLLGALFVGVIIWEFVIFLLFGNAIRNYCHRNVTQAYGVSFGLFAGFIIIDDIIGAFGIENSHRNILIMLIATYLYIYLTSKKYSQIPEG
ncbi:MAG: hypothetical protein ABEK59_04195 [Halobacteria archaeon]